MAIYRINGDELGGAFSLNGNALTEAFDKTGSVVYTKAQPGYDNPSITNIGGSVAASNTQGCAVYGDILAVWNGGDQVRLYNVNSLASIATISTGYSIHGNDISFSDEFYDSADTLPLLYVDSTPGFRLFQNNGSWSSSLILELSTPGIYGMKIAAGFNGNTLITIGYSENRYTYTSTNKLIIAEWNMSNLTDNGDGTYTPELLGTVTRDWLECIQGAAYHDGYLWVASGLGNTGNKGRVYALNLETGAIEVDINTEDTHELEGLSWAYNSTDGWYIIVGQVGIGYRKITFQNS